MKACHFVSNLAPTAVAQVHADTVAQQLRAGIRFPPNNCTSTNLTLVKIHCVISIIALFKKAQRRRRRRRRELFFLRVWLYKRVKDKIEEERWKEHPVHITVKSQTVIKQMKVTQKLLRAKNLIKHDAHPRPQLHFKLCLVKLK